MKKRGAALILVLAVLALTGSLITAAGVRAYGVKAAQTRTERQIRLRMALWDAAWRSLQTAAREAGPIPGPVEREAPDGVATSMKVERLDEGKRGGPVRFALSVTARLDRDRRDAWALVQRTGTDLKILTWVER